MAWGAIEDNRFGTHEFLDYTASAGAEPYICANLGTGTWDEAQQWVEYVNFDGDTATTRLRKKNGRDKPWKVTYWGLGNEMDGPWQMGHRTAEDYGKFALESAKLMHWTDQLIRSAAANAFEGWGAEPHELQVTLLTADPGDPGIHVGETALQRVDLGRPAAADDRPRLIGAARVHDFDLHAEAFLEPLPGLNGLGEQDAGVDGEDPRFRLNLGEHVDEHRLLLLERAGHRQPWMELLHGIAQKFLGRSLLEIGKRGAHAVKEARRRTRPRPG